MQKEYVHRVGRTARNGQNGTATSLAGREDRRLVKDIVKCGGLVSQRILSPEGVEKCRQHIAEIE